MPSHSKQNICPNNKAKSSVLQIKQKNKRRNRKKRKHFIHDIRMSNTTTTNSKPIHIDNTTDSSYTIRNQMAVAQMWAKSYETMIRGQYQHRIQYWKNLAVNRNTEIIGLRESLRKLKEENCKYLDEKVNSTDDDNVSVKSNQEDLDSEAYLKFLEITLRHRQERKKHKSNDIKDEETDSD